jgi:uncharacterized protein
MTTIAIFGATGYSGGNIAEEALSRGHRVIAVARNTRRLAGRTDMDVRQGSLFRRGIRPQDRGRGGRDCGCRAGA